MAGKLFPLMHSCWLRNTCIFRDCRGEPKGHRSVAAWRHGRSPGIFSHSWALFLLKQSPLASRMPWLKGTANTCRVPGGLIPSVFGSAIGQQPMSLQKWSTSCSKKFWDFVLCRQAQDPTRLTLGESLRRFLVVGILVTFRFGWAVLD